MYHDGARAGVSPTDARSVGRIGVGTMLVLTVAGFVVVSRVWSLMANPSPWLDEAMLLLNFQTIEWAAAVRPLPLFEQAAPLGYVLLGKAAAAAAGPSVTEVLRCVSAVASLASAALFYRLVVRPRGHLEAALATCMLMMSQALVFHAIEIKQYGFEALATVAIIASAARASRRGSDAAAMAVFVACGLGALFFSFSGAVIIAGFGAALFLEHAVDPARDRRALARVVGAGLFLAVVGVVVYFAYSRPSVQALMDGHAERYARGDLQFPPLNGRDLREWLNLAGVLENGYLRPLPGWMATSGFAGLAVLGWRTLAGGDKPARLLAAGSALSLFALCATAVLGVFTPYAERHLVFIAPIMALLVSSGLARLVRAASRALPERFSAHAVGAILGLFVVAYGARGLSEAARPEREPLRAALKRIQGEGGWPGQTWVDYAAQPAAEVLTFPQPPAYLGQVSHRSVPTSWYADVIRVWPEQVRRFEREMAVRPRLYLLFSHVSRGANRERDHGAQIDQLVAAAERQGARCRLLESGKGRRGEAGAYRCDRLAAPVGDGEPLG